MSESPWSASRFFGKFLSIVSMILTPAVDPALYSWIGAAFIPVFSAAVVLVLLAVMVSRAKRAMSEATPLADASTADPARQAPARVPSDVSHQTELAAAKESQRTSLVGKWVFSFGAVGALFGLVICLIVFVFLSRAIERQVKNRIEIITMGLAENVTRAVASGKLDAAGLVENYALSTSVAYLYIEDANGEIIDRWPKEMLRYLRRDFPGSTERALAGIEGEYRGAETFEIARPFGDGKLGFVHLAIWRESIRAEAQRFTALIAGAIVMALLPLAGASVLLGRSLCRPLVELVEQAKSLSNGDFNVPLALQREDELGDIARSLERLRSSLRAVAARLGKAQLPDRSGE
jgi:HAMP domain-containing protein